MAVLVLVVALLFNTAHLRALLLVINIGSIWLGHISLGIRPPAHCGDGSSPWCVPLLGIMDKSTYALFGNEAVFFILGAFILAAALTGTGISARLARAMLVRFGKTLHGWLLWFSCCRRCSPSS
jgi:di/tricarboxylate transporter